MQAYGAVALQGQVGGATTPGRWVGTTASGPPTSGTFSTGDWIVARDCAIWICTAGGTPGTWLLSGRVLVGTLGSIPTAAPANKGMVYLVTDILGGTPYYSDGSAWSNFAASVDVSGVTASGAILRGIVDAKGDLVIATAADTPGRLAVGAPGEMLRPDSSVATGLDWIDDPYVGSIRPTGAVAETVPRTVCNSAAILAGTTGQLRMVGIWLPARLVVTSITFLIGNTSISGASHGWYALFDSARALLRQSTNDTTPAATTGVAETYNLSSTFTTTYAGLHYLGCMWVATTMPTLNGVSPSSAVTLGLAPVVAGTSTGSLTTTAPNPAAAITATSGSPYAYVS